MKANQMFEHDFPFYFLGV